MLPSKVQQRLDHHTLNPPSVVLGTPLLYHKQQQQQQQQHSIIRRYLFISDLGGHDQVTEQIRHWPPICNDHRTPVQLRGPFHLPKSLLNVTLQFH